MSSATIGDRLVVLARGLDLRAQALVKVAVVREPRQRVRRREPLEPLALVADDRRHTVEAVRELAQLGGAVGLEASAVVALLHSLHGGAKMAERPCGGPLDEPDDPADQPRGEQCTGATDHHHQRRATEV